MFNIFVSCKNELNFSLILSQIQSIMSFYGCNMNLELQQRAVEYNSIIRIHNNLSEGLFEQMPPIEMKTNSTYSNGIACEENDEPISEEERRQMQLLQQQEAAKTLIDIFKDDQSSNEVSVTTKTQNNNDLFDLMNDDGPSTVKTSTTTSSIANKSTTSNNQNDLDLLFSTNPSSTVVTKPTPATIIPTSKDIFDIFESNSTSSSTAAIKDKKSPQFSSNNGLDDLLGFSGPSLPSQPTKYDNSQIKPSSSSPNDLFDIFSAPAPTSHHPNLSSFQLNNGHKSDTTKTSEIVGYDKNDLKIIFEKAKSSSGDQYFIQMTASNSSVSTTIREFLFGVAVPKSMQMQLSQPTTSAIEPLDSMSQMITIKNPNKVTFFYQFFTAFHILL